MNNPRPAQFDADVVVVGGGIGGTCAAIALAHRGASVLLLEASTFPRHKVCGEFLSPEIFDTFRRLGVEIPLKADGAVPVHKARIYSSGTRGRSLEIALPHAAYGLSRYVMDAALWEAAQAAGVRTHSQHRVRRIEQHGSGFCISSSGGDLRARFVIAAAGRNAKLLNDDSPAPQTPRYVGFKAHFQKVRDYDGAVELHAYEGGYFGVGAIENGLVNVCWLARYETVAGRSADEFLQWQMLQCPSLRRRLESAQQATPWLATGNVHFRHYQPVQDGVLFVGDAAGYIHPLTGNGMAMAARSGELAGALIASGLRGEILPQDIHSLYVAAWQREFGARLKWATRLEAALVSARWVSPTLWLLSQVPSLAQATVQLTRG